MVVGRQMRERGEPDQAESASKELTAFVGLYKSHHTWLVSCSHAVSFERHPIAAPYIPNPQQALFTSSNPATKHNLGIRKLCAEHSNLLVQHFVVLRNLRIDLLHTTPSIIIFLTGFGIQIVPVQQHTRCASQRQYPHADHPPHIHVIEVPYNMYHLIC